MKKILIITIIFISLFSFFIFGQNIYAQGAIRHKCEEDSLNLKVNNDLSFIAEGCLIDNTYNAYLNILCSDKGEITSIKLSLNIDNGYLVINQDFPDECIENEIAYLGLSQDSNRNNNYDPDEIIPGTFQIFDLISPEPIDEVTDEPIDEQNQNNDEMDITQTGPTKETFDLLNPLKQLSSGEAKDDFFADGAVTPANIINRVMKFLFPIAGMILFVMLIWGGFEILGQAATKKSMDAGRQRITAAIGGFFLLFISYWLMQLVEVIFGVKIL